jgi:hypothetical protein
MKHTKGPNFFEKKNISKKTLNRDCFVVNVYYVDLNEAVIFRHVTVVLKKMRKQANCDQNVIFAMIQINCN